MCRYIIALSISSTSILRWYIWYCYYFIIYLFHINFLYHTLSQFHCIDEFCSCCICMYISIPNLKKKFLSNSDLLCKILFLVIQNYMFCVFSKIYEILFGTFNISVILNFKITCNQFFAYNSFYQMEMIIYWLWNI